ncbi:LOW QUALITY PROTEIN: hypothetical protein CVT26_011777 [Gymnopilus dilepis]|uniref:Uncharacterized protein n=1 Tax=Gymnopilus dilepis TaxID=231916 RepID=A0A409W921_9AGAR|nr:LOW QUALITY PROTEIN: hypothetical protein CVT26_011777 [Gymnopilus dilepis]
MTPSHPRPVRLSQPFNPDCRTHQRSPQAPLRSFSALLTSFALLLPGHTEYIAFGVSGNPATPAASSQGGAGAQTGGSSFQAAQTLSPLHLLSGLYTSTARKYSCSPPSVLLPVPSNVITPHVGFNGTSTTPAHHSNEAGEKSRERIVLPSSKDRLPRASSI